MSDRQIENFLKAKSDPVWFVKNVIKSDLYDYQKNVLNSVKNNPKVAWRSGHGCGKTATSAWTALWFLTTRTRSKVITTASAWRQVQKQLWPEIHRWHRKADWEVIGWHLDDFIPLSLMMKIKGYDDWFATGEASDVPEKMEGFHADNIFFIIDEAKAVLDATFESIEGALTTGGSGRGEAKQLVISTPPPEKVGYFYNIFTRKVPGYTLHHTSSVDSPNVSREWIEGRKNAWGEDSAIYKNRVEGEFSDTSDDTLIPLKYIEEAVNKEVETGPDYYNGVDVARFGSDRTVVLLRNGQKVVKIKVVKQYDVMQVSGLVKGSIDTYNPIAVNIDVIGIGSGVVDRLKELGYKNIVGINVGAGARDSEKFKNLRAELYWGIRERFLQGDISIPDDEELIGELANIKYKYTSRNQILIESKDDIKKRGLKSPDKADALVLAFADMKRSIPILDYYKTETERIKKDGETSTNNLKPNERPISFSN